MATPQEKLAESLEALKELQDAGVVAIQSKHLSRTHRERLTKQGFLEEVIRGWYISSRPDEASGESTAWYASYWEFCSSYLNEQKSEDWCLSPEQSLSLHAENWTVPRQLIVRANKANGLVTNLPFETSLLLLKTTMPEKKNIVVQNGIRMYSLTEALLACAPSSFQHSPTDMRAALAMVQDSSEVLSHLLEGGHSVKAGRLAGAFRNIGREAIADEIVSTMKSAGYDVRENDPFEEPSPISFAERERSPYVNRIRLMWQQMRETVIAEFPEAPGLTQDIEQHLKDVEEIYKTDAYHSLSIEGYRVTLELIEQVRSGDWNPYDNEDDKEQVNAMAARGYWQAFQVVKDSIEKILGGADPGVITSADHRDWYREMFSPSVTAGILKAGDLAGYRNGPVYIRRSMHTPPRVEAVRDAMPTLFELIKDEENPAVRVVLGHFIFVYIHPYFDGNGRMGRFLMNCMMAAGGYPWTVIPVERKDDYMAALEEASVCSDIAPFTKFLAALVEV